MSKTASQSVLMVLPWSPLLPGGVSVVVRSLAKQLSGSPLKPLIIVNKWNAPRATVDAEGNLNFRFALIVSATWSGLVKAVLVTPMRLARTLWLLHTRRVAAVNFHYPNLDALGIALLKRLHLFSGRLILSFHGTDVRQPSTTLERRLWKFLFASVDGISACSSALATHVGTAFGIPAERITVIHNGVDAEQFSPEATSNAVFQAELPQRYLVSVGSYIPRKGHRILVDAFAQLAQEFPEIGLVIVGQDGPERVPLLLHAEALGLRNRFQCLVGLSPEAVAPVVARAVACVQPSFAEPFGLAVIEAGACGIPVAASAVGGHLELLQDGETGFLFPPQDSMQCASVLRQILGDLGAARIIANRFRNTILDRYTWQICAKAYLELASKEK